MICCSNLMIHTAFHLIWSSIWPKRVDGVSWDFELVFQQKWLSAMPRWLKQLLPRANNRRLWVNFLLYQKLFHCTTLMFNNEVSMRVFWLPSLSLRGWVQKTQHMRLFFLNLVSIPKVVVKRAIMVPWQQMELLVKSWIHRRKEGLFSIFAMDHLKSETLFMVQLIGDAESNWWIIILQSTSLVVRLDGFLAHTFTKQVQTNLQKSLALILPITED